jgi:hypothetical protein
MQQEDIMASMRVDYTTMEWSSAAPFYGAAAVYDGKDIVQLKVLSDRRKDGGGIAWLVKMTPPPGKLIKIVAVALSDEHIFSLQGGRSTKSGERAQRALRLPQQRISSSRAGRSQTATPNSSCTAAAANSNCGMASPDSTRTQHADQQDHFPRRRESDCGRRIRQSGCRRLERRHRHP